MKKFLILIIAILLFLTSFLTFSGCSNNDDDCFICGGSGYYQKKDCPGC